MRLIVRSCGTRRREAGTGRRSLALAPWRFTYLEFADLTLDQDTYEVRRGSQLIELSPTEFRLLRYFMLNPGRVLSRVQLLEHVWDYDFGGSSTVVSTYVAYLRRKLATAGPDLIHTQQGALTSPDQVDEVMRRITLETRRMGQLVDDMLRLARLGQHPGQSSEPVDVTALVHARERFYRAADARSARPPGSGLGLAIAAEIAAAGQAQPNGLVCSRWP